MIFIYVSQVLNVVIDDSGITPSESALVISPFLVTKKKDKKKPTTSCFYVHQSCLEVQTDLYPHLRGPQHGYWWVRNDHSTLCCDNFFPFWMQTNNYDWGYNFTYILVDHVQGVSQWRETMHPFKFQCEQTTTTEDSVLSQLIHDQQIIFLWQDPTSEREQNF